jgi:hypothetical protein
MPYSPYEMAGLLMPYNDAPHLFAVMNDPCPDGQCLVLMVTTLKAGRYHDPACLLNVGDHPFIRHPSWIAYRIAETPRAAHVGNMVDKKLFIPRDDWTPAVFNRLAAGIYNSDDTRGGIIKYANANNI